MQEIWVIKELISSWWIALKMRCIWYQQQHNSILELTSKISDNNQQYKEEQKNIYEIFKGTTDNSNFKKD